MRDHVPENRPAARSQRPQTQTRTPHTALPPNLSHAYVDTEHKPWRSKTRHQPSYFTRDMHPSTHTQAPRHRAAPARLKPQRARIHHLSFPPHPVLSSTAPIILDRDQDPTNAPHQYASQDFAGCTGSSGRPSLGSQTLRAGRAQGHETVTPTSQGSDSAQRHPDQSIHNITHAGENQPCATSRRSEINNLERARGRGGGSHPGNPTASADKETSTPYDRGKPSARGSPACRSWGRSRAPG